MASAIYSAAAGPTPWMSLCQKSFLASQWSANLLTVPNFSARIFSWVGFSLRTLIGSFFHASESLASKRGRSVSSLMNFRSSFVFVSKFFFAASDWSLRFFQVT